MTAKLFDPRRNHIGAEVKVLDDGFVRIVDFMGDDFFPVRTARLSYDNRVGTDDETLLRLLLRHRHSEPFEFNVVVLHVRAPMDVWRQWLRHRTTKFGSVNEYSTRYTPAIDSSHKAEGWRAQSGNNKQGSDGFVLSWPEGWNVKYLGPEADLTEITKPDGEMYFAVGAIESPAEWLSQDEESIQKAVRRSYEDRLALGVAKEQARKDLPLSTYTEMYVKCDLWNLMHFLGLRMDSHAQQEIREYAGAVAKHVEVLFPKSFHAFEDYCLNAMFLTRLDVEALSRLIVFNDRMIEDAAASYNNKRERAEFLSKVERFRSCLTRPHDSSPDPELTSLNSSPELQKSPA